jgi:signal transduction histidine kinase
MNLRQMSAVTTKLPIMGICIGMLVIAALSYASLRNIASSQKNTAWVEHTHQVRFQLEQTAFLASDSQAAVRGYLISNNPNFLAPYDDSSRRLPALLGALKELVSDNRFQTEKVELLTSSVANFMGLMKRTVELRREATEPTRAMAFVAEGAGDQTLAKIRTQISELQDAEAILLAQREQQVRSSSHGTTFSLIAGTGLAFLLLGGTFFLLSHEMRQRRRADAALTLSNATLLRHAAQLEQSNQELESFSYSISHDLRIPLRAVSGYASMLAEDYESILDEEGRRLLNVIRSNGKQMGILIDDLLAFSKLGRQRLSATEVDMHALAANILNDVRDREPLLAATVVVDPLPVAKGDRALLRQVWTNLISNAVKYSSKNPLAEVRISGSSNETESTYSVSDNGVGFDMVYYEKLFGVFQRLHAADEFPGTGVGLAIVHRIITRHGGRIWAESEIGKGSIFYFALPHKELS